MSDSDGVVGISGVSFGVPLGVTSVGEPAGALSGIGAEAAGPLAAAAFKISC